MGLDAGERRHRPDLGHYHFRRPAWHRSLGAWAAGRHQYVVRRLGADRDGAVCPRDRSAFGCPGALSEAALIGKNLTRNVGGAGVPRSPPKSLVLDIVERVTIAANRIDIWLNRGVYN